MDGIAPKLSPGNPVWLKNVGTEPFVGRFEQVIWTIQPDQSMLVTAAQMWHWLGRPHLVDDRENGHLDRKEEHRRLRLLYSSRIAEGEMSEQDVWEQNKPQLEAYNDGQFEQRIITVVDDPEGTHVTPATASKNEQDIMKTTVEALKNQIKQLMAESDRRAQGDVKVAEDSPSRVPVSS